jgi:hypothetical protein
MMDKFIEERCVRIVCFEKWRDYFKISPTNGMQNLHANLGSNSRDRKKIICSRELEDMRSSSSQPHHRQSSLLQNSTSTCERFSKAPIFIPIDIKKFFPNHLFKITCFMFSVYKTCLLHRYA